MTEHPTLEGRKSEPASHCGMCNSAPGTPVVRRAMLVECIGQRMLSFPMRFLAGVKEDMKTVGVREEDGHKIRSRQLILCANP